MSFDNGRFAISLSLVALAAGCSSTAQTAPGDVGSASNDGGASVDGGSRGNGDGGAAGTGGGSSGGEGGTVGGNGGLDVPPAATRGASVPYWEYEAEDPKAATTTGAVLPVNNAEGQITGEASGRTVVELTQPGQYVSFTLQHRTNSIVVRY